MCGRTCLTLSPDQIRHACKYVGRNLYSENKADSKEIEVVPEWRSEYNFGKTYQPSYNIVPTDITPVLVSGEHFMENGDKLSDRVIVPMLWGMVPFWHKGDYRKHGLSTNNCRLEHMADSKLYHGPFQKGQRCVILCEGYYEWQTTQSAKPSKRAAFFLYMPQRDGVKIYDRTTWNDKINLIKLAGLFDIWQDDNGDKVYSYSVITFDSSTDVSWLHNRMPAILETEEQVNNWLNFKHVSDAQAMSALRPATTLQWYQVSNIVNNSRNKSEDCNKPFNLCANKKPSNRLTKWLVIRKKREADIKEGRRSDSDDDLNSYPPPKRVRIKPKSNEDDSYSAEK